MMNLKDFILWLSIPEPSYSKIKDGIMKYASLIKELSINPEYSNLEFDQEMLHRTKVYIIILY